MRRRTFLKAAGGALCVSWGTWGWSAPVDSLEAAFAEAGFVPNGEGNAFFVVTTDIHYTPSKPGNATAFRTLISDVENMPTKPAFVAILGDCVCSLSPSFGSKPNFAAANVEFDLLRPDLERLGKVVPVRVIPGNHDTPSGEENAEYFCGKLGIKPYDTWEQSGAKFLFLNGRQDGFPGAEETTWLRTELANVPKDQTLIFAMHQPLGVSNERGLTMALPELLAEHRGQVYLLTGHEHMNFEKTWKLAHVNLHEFCHISCGGGWKSEGASYWVYGLSGGDVVVRVWRTTDGKWVVFPKYSEQPAHEILQPFGRYASEIVVRGLMGQDDTLEILDSQGGNCGTYYFYLTSVSARIPLGRRGMRLAILGRLDSGFNGKAQPNDVRRHVWLSGGDGQEVEVSLPQREAGDVYVLPIPEELRNADKLTVRIQSFGYRANDVFAGLAVLR